MWADQAMQLVDIKPISKLSKALKNYKEESIRI